MGPHQGHSSLPCQDGPAPAPAPTPHVSLLLELRLHARHEDTVSVTCHPQVQVKELRLGDVKTLVHGHTGLPEFRVLSTIMFH